MEQYDELIIIATPTKFTHYVKGKRSTPVFPGPLGEVSAYPGANIKVFEVEEQELGEDLSSIVGMDTAPQTHIN